MSVDGGLRKLFRTHVRGVHWVTVETGFTTLGVPDSNGCCDGVEFWLEYKFIKRGWVVGLRPAQVGWLVTRARHGGRTFIAVRRQADGADRLYIYDGKHARELKDGGMRNAPSLGEWSGGPIGWDWTAVRFALVLR